MSHSPSISPAGDFTVKAGASVKDKDSDVVIDENGNMSLGSAGSKLDISDAGDGSTPSAGSIRLYGVTQGGISRLETRNSTDSGVDILRDQTTVVYNGTGSAIGAFKVVTINGVAPDGHNPTVILTDSNDAAKMPALGITIAAIPDGSYGIVLIRGLVSFGAGPIITWSAGGKLWVTISGDLTPTQTASPNEYQQSIGLAIDPANGWAWINTGSEFYKNDVDFKSWIHAGLTSL